MNRKSLYVGSLVMALTLLASFALIPAGNAYGKSNWQTTFSGNCNNQSLCGGHGGFWGWCAFGGGSGNSPVQSGNNADCEQANYGFFPGNPVDGPVHVSVSGSAWVIAYSDPAFGGTGFNDFFVTAGTFTLSGPGELEIVASFGVPPGCTLSNSGNALTCQITAPMDTLPAVPGHLSNSICGIFSTGPISAPGCHYNQQVTELP